MTRYVTIQVYGRVQGVNFRSSTCKEATRLGICGTVKNKSDGSVFIEAAGEQVALDHLIRWCQQGGPPMGRADKMIVNPGQDNGCQDFDIIF